MPQPHALSEKNFQQYAPFIGQALDAFPNTITVSTTGSVETFAARFRDARKAKDMFGYTSPSIDERLYTLHAARLGVAMRDGAVVIGPKESLRNARCAALVPSLPPSSSEIAFSGSKERLWQLCELLALSLFKPQPIFSITLDNPDDALTLEKVHGVTVIADTKNPGGFLLL